MNSKKLPRFGSTNAFIFSVVLVLVSALMFATPTLADDGRTEMEVVSSSTTGSLDITVRSNGRQDVSIYAWTRGEDGETNRHATICKIPVHATDKASNNGFAFVGSQACSIASYGFDFGEVLLKATRKISGGSFTWDSWWVTVNYHGIDGYSDDGGLEISHADSTSNGLLEVTVRSNGTQDVTVWGWTEDDAGNIFHKGIVCRIMVAAADKANNDGFYFFGTGSCDLNEVAEEAGVVHLQAQRAQRWNLEVYSNLSTANFTNTRLESLSVSTSSRNIFPYKDGYEDSGMVEVTVRGLNSRGNKVPFSAKVALNGKNISTKSTLSLASSLTFEIKVNPKEFRTNKIQVTGTGIENEVRTKTVTVSVVPTGVEKARVVPNQRTVYPVKDGYRDSAGIKVYVEATTPKKLVKTQGTLVVKNSSGQTVKSWAVDHSGTSKFDWNGRVNGRIIPGKYFIALNVVGPQGKPVTSETEIKVSDQEVGWSAVAHDKHETSALEGDIKSVAANYNQLTGTASVVVTYWRTSHDFAAVDIRWGPTCNGDINELTASTEIYDVGVLNGYLKDTKRGKHGTKVYVDVYNSKKVEYIIDGPKLRNRDFSCVSVSTWWESNYWHVDWDCECVTKIYNEDAVSVRRR